MVGYSCAQAMAGRPGCDAIGGHLDLFDPPRVESLLLNTVVGKLDLLEEAEGVAAAYAYK